MAMRFYAAIITGAFTAMISGFGLWSLTKWNIEDVLVTMAVLYVFVPVAFLMITDRKKVKK